MKNKCFRRDCKREGTHQRAMTFQVNGGKKEILLRYWVCEKHRRKS